MEDVSLGSFLKEKREKRGIKLEDIVRETKILKKTLEAVENNDFSRIPFVYLKGIIKKYAQLVKLEEDEIERILSVISEKEEKTDKGKKEIKIKIKKREINWAKIFLIFCVGGYFLYEIIFFLLPPKIVIENFPKAVSQENIILSGKVLRAKRVYLNGKEIFLKNNEIQEEIVLQEGVNNIEIKAVNALGKTTSILLNVLYKKENNNIASF
jgi:transcriptional regulator with XRE-family HTH domain